MPKHKKEILSLTAKQVLLNIFDVCSPFFKANKIYKTSTNKFLSNNEKHKNSIKERIYYLKRMGYIETFVENKEEYIEITNKGYEKVTSHIICNPVIKKSAKWDKKWRVVIFDVPEKQKNSRNFFRQKIIKSGFIKIQESVYVYPFECSSEIYSLSQEVGIEKYVVIMISTIIQGESNIIKQFIDNHILTDKDIEK